MCHKWPWICSTCRNDNPILTSFMTYHRFVTRVTRWVPRVKQELLTLKEWGSCCSICIFLCNVLLIVFCPLSFGHCIVCRSSIYGFWLCLGYLQTFLQNAAINSSQIINHSIRPVISCCRRGAFTRPLSSGTRRFYLSCDLILSCVLSTFFLSVFILFM